MDRGFGDWADDKPRWLFQGCRILCSVSVMHAQAPQGARLNSRNAPWEISLHVLNLLSLIFRTLVRYF